MNIALLVTALIGFSSVLLGSFAEHSLKAQLTQEFFDKFMIGLRYQQLYSVILLVLATNTSHIKKAFWPFCFATVTFSSSIYAYVLLDSKIISYITPIGGIALLIAWLYLAYIALKH